MDELLDKNDTLHKKIQDIRIKKKDFLQEGSCSILIEYTIPRKISNEEIKELIF